MNKDAITQVLQEILQEDPNYFVPKQLHILSWKSKKIEGALITKINGQRYLGTLRKDKTGQDYWSYKLLTNESPANSSTIASNPQEISAQAESQVTVEKNPEESEQVKKFRAKYGNPNQTQKSTGE